MLFNHSLTATNKLRQTIRDYYRIDENTILNQLITLAEINVDAKLRAWEYARKLVVNIRKEQIGKGGVDALLNEFSLSSEEGVVLMCLAEALLRVPDDETADDLIRDKLASGDWSSHIGNSESLFVNASSWGLVMTGKLVNYSDEKKYAQFGVLKRMVGRVGEPMIRKAVRYAMKIMGTQFVMGHNIAQALQRSKIQQAKGYTYSYDMLGEGARTMRDADRYFASYLQAIEAIGNASKGKGPQQSPGISIKLSAIHPRYEFSNQQRVFDELIPRLKQLALAAKAYNIGFTIDAEEADRLDISLDIIEAVFADNALTGWDGFGIAVQAYQKRALYVIEWVRELTQKVGRRMMVRLVKGAYWDSEIKNSQVEGYAEFPVFSRKPSTDVSYQACAKLLLAYRDSIYPQFATHNAYTVATIIELAGQLTGFEFQRLHGMGESLYDQVLLGKHVPCRVYAPVGEHADLLAYLVRRLLENGANSSFVNNIVDEHIPVESLLIDPLETVSAWQNKVNPQIPSSLHLYGTERLNSKGIDLTDVVQLSTMKANMDAWWQTTQQTVAKQTAEQTTAIPVTNPANLTEVVGYIEHIDEAAMSALVSKCHGAFKTWSTTKVTERAELLLKTADALETHRDELIGLCCKEAGKNIADGVAEVREAVDFCRYYAARATELFTDNSLVARGVVLCISPWNFPLAIFLGQVSAALITGNTVVAKPAEQTSLIALRTVELMRQLGLPEGVVEIVIARGSKVGKTIVPDERIQAVMFTGSTETGAWIAQKLAEREGEPVPLIAETGGQNCMIVDSTALPEQVVDDVIASGFQSAGQRCSALRVLFLQADIADKVIAMISGAMQQLQLDDPSLLSTDIGPVIDEKAHTALSKHVDYLQQCSTLHYQCELPELAFEHHFFAPRLVEIKDLSVLKAEVFGPIVHVVRYKADAVDDVMNQINATGFGLTMGIHTRIAQKSKYLAARSRAGNVYVNRNMIGAVVGVQPFGGRALSGTGPKAGGPWYLTRLVKSIVTPAPTRLSASQWQQLQQRFNEAKVQSNTVASSMHLAEQRQIAWSIQPVNNRLSLLRQLLAHLASHPVDVEPTELTKALSAARAQLLTLEKTLAKPTTLPGPTGESNTLHLEARGVLACIRCEQSSFEFWLVSVISALAAGNCVISIIDEHASAQSTALCASLDAVSAQSGLLQSIALSQLPTLLAQPTLAGVIIAPNSALIQWVNQQLAARQGAITPVLTAHSASALITRLVTEKTITIDTTAAGGNASLMTMAANLV